MIEAYCLRPSMVAIASTRLRPRAVGSSVAVFAVAQAYFMDSNRSWPQFRPARPTVPRAWSDRLHEFFADVHLHPVDGIGHFTPLEAPAALARLIDLHGQG